MNKKQWLWLILIMAVTIFGRFYKLGETPKGFHRDEAALGYNAYSILETGRDEFGKPWPVLFRSFVDFKAPVYTYLLVPIYKIFGMNVWSTRLLSAIAGVIGVWFSFWLIKNLSKKINLALITTSLLAISPWHLIFSRTSYETNVSLTFLIIAIWSFYKYRENNKWLILTAIMAGLSFLTYHSERVIVPLIFLGLFINERKNLFDKINIKILTIAFLVGVGLTLPTIKLMTTPGFLSRINSLSILSDGVKKPWGFSENLLGWKNIIFNNKQILQTREFSSLYSSYFSPRHLFSLGDSEPRFSYPGLAPFWFWELPFLMIGLKWLFSKTKKQQNNFKFIVILLMLISPIPASITRDPFSSVRALPLVLPLTILIAIGINNLIEKYNKIIIILLMVMMIWSGGKIYLSVFKFNDYFRGFYWEEGVEEVVKNINNQTLPVVVDSARGNIYSQILFFTKADPKEYQENNFEVVDKDYYTNMKRVREKRINNIFVRPLIWHKDIFVEQILVGDWLTINEDQMREHCLSLVFEVKDREGRVLYRGVKTHPKDKIKFELGDTFDGKIINACVITTP